MTISVTGIWIPEATMESCQTPLNVKNRLKQRGFTLLEIMLVVVLIGLSASVILPKLSGNNGPAALRTETRRFAALVHIAHETAITTGTDLGVEINNHQYTFLRWQNNQWVPLTGHRLLRPVTLNAAFTLSVKPGESIWQEMLEKEKNGQIQTLLDKADEEKKQQKKPSLFIWSSGEFSPAEIQFTQQPFVQKQTSALAYRVTVFEESDITVTDSTGAPL